MNQIFLALAAAGFGIVGGFAQEAQEHPFAQPAPQQVRERIMRRAGMSPKAQHPEAGSQPVIATGGIVNAASFRYTGSIAAGEAISIFGSLFTMSTASFSGSTLPTTLGGVQVTVDGFYTPLYFVSPGQINAQVPYTVRQGTSVKVVVINVANNQSGPPATIGIASVQPGLYSANGVPMVQDAATGQLVGTATKPLVVPATRSTYIVLYAAGFGPTTPVLAAGLATPYPPLYNCQMVVAAKLGGVPLRTAFAGFAPWYIGLYQVNFEVPSSVPVGSQLLETTVSGVSAQSFTVVVARQ